MNSLSRRHFIGGSIFTVALPSALVPQAAQALVISNEKYDASSVDGLNDYIANHMGLQAPFPFWDNVVGIDVEYRNGEKMGGGTSVGLGEKRFLTAAHVILDANKKGRNKIVRIHTSGTKKKGVSGMSSAEFFTSTKRNGKPRMRPFDIASFSLDSGLGCPDLEIAKDPQIGEHIIYIGAGDVAKKMRKARSRKTGAAFREVSNDLGEKRWAANTIVGSELSRDEEYFTPTFFTDLTKGNINEGHCCPGDSGGGVFVFRDGSWKLLGLMISKDNWTQKVSYENRTFFVPAEIVLADRV